MTLTNFQPEIWAAQVLSILPKAQVYAGLCNRDYEGDIAQQGDTVHIVSIGDPTIRDYAKSTDMTTESLTDADRLLTIDQMKYFNFSIDDVDVRQGSNPTAVWDEAASRAAFGLRDVTDKFVAEKMVVDAGASLGIVDATTVTNVYDKLVVGARTKLAQANVPTEGRWLVVDPATMGQLLLDGRFIKANESGSADSLRNGFVGRAGGFNIYESNNSVTSNRTVASITTASGAKSLTGVAEQFNQGDVGLSVTGTGVGASAKVVSVSADGSVANVDVNSSASAAVTVTLTGGGQVAIAGSSLATSYAEQITKVESFRIEKQFGNGLKGLHLYGAKTVRGSALVVASVKTA